MLSFITRRIRPALETVVCAALVTATSAGVSLAVVAEYTPSTGAELAPAAASSPVPARRVALRWLTRHPRFLDLPSCAVEDASNGPVPCSWNVHAGDGNGYGGAYFVTGSNARPVFHDIPGGAR